MKFVPVSSGCWLWTAGKMADGYGMFDKQRAHRFMFELANKRKVSAGHLICHTCDNRRCVNPEHLFEGTHTDNMVDASKKGRLRGGRPRKH